MKIAYFNCFAGASGDMILGALIDAGLDLEALKKELQKLHLHEADVQAAKITKKGISGTKFDVIISGHTDTPHSGHNQGHTYEKSHTHKHRNLYDIENIIDKSTLSDNVKQRSKTIFKNLARAEAKIHNKTIEEIHFHEVGATDSIIDIVGAVIGLELLGIDEVSVSEIHVGTGTVECAHGTLPVPAPATIELLKDKPVYSTGIQNELITPTGAAILISIASSFGPMPKMKPIQTGYGAGFHDLPIANLLRVTIGESLSEHHQDHVQLIETNIDDMNPQFYEYIMEKLFQCGAKDVYLNQVIMKKGRPGTILSIISGHESTDACVDCIFQETTTLGVRISEMKKRTILKREFIEVDTPWGKGQVKIRVLDNNSMTYEPEYEDCKRLAKENHIPVQKVFDVMKQEAEKAYF